MNKRLVWFTELFLWVLLVLSLILGFSYSFATSEQKNHSYYMFFKDVDGLSKGSPVRMMGVQIGYVSDVKVFKDNIFVSFLVTQKDVFIPTNSVAKVEFYGLGGSKSLEIEPPTSTSLGQEVIITQNPYRIDSYYKLGAQINSTLEAVMTNTSMMLDAYINSDITIPFLMKGTQKFNNMIQSFVENEEQVLIKELNRKVKKFNEKHKNIGTEENISEHSNRKEINTNETNCNQ